MSFEKAVAWTTGDTVSRNVGPGESWPDGIGLVHADYSVLQMIAVGR